MRTRSTPSQSGHPPKRRAPASERRDRQIVRVLALLRVLAQGTTANIHELAATFGTRRETIYRDLRVLQDAGYPIHGDERGRLSRPRLMAFRTPEIPFSASELKALLAAVAQAQVALPTTASLQGAASKLKALGATDAQSSRLDDLCEAWFCGQKDFRSSEDHMAILMEGMLRKQCCRVHYRKPSATGPKSFDFEPYRFLFVGGGLYVVGHVPKYDGTATLAVERIVAITLTGSHFEVDPAFDPHRCRFDAFGVSWQDPKQVVLRFRADQAVYVRERLWHPSQEITDLPDGSISLSFRAGGPFEIRRWILGWGDAVEVLAPDELRQEVKSMLRSALDNY